MKSRNKTPPKKRGGGGGGGGGAGGQRNNGNNNNKKKRRRTNISKYCWSCGAWNHLGKNCRFKKEGHKIGLTVSRGGEHSRQLLIVQCQTFKCCSMNNH